MSIVGSLPKYPGILAAIMISPGLANALRGLADELLVKSFPGSTLTCGERRLVATAVSAKNDCFFCIDSHVAFASALLRNDGVDSEIVDTLIADLKCRALPRCPRILWAEKDYVAEGVGFEPTVQFPVHTLSKRAP